MGGERNRRVEREEKGRKLNFFLLKNENTYKSLFWKTVSNTILAQIFRSNYQITLKGCLDIYIWVPKMSPPSMRGNIIE